MVRILRQKEFTSFDIAAAVGELKPSIDGSRVNNIYQLGEKTLVFKLHKTGAPPMRLIVEAGRRLHSTSYAPESPANPPPFCMSLRKYLRASWLTDIEQYEFERIVTIKFKARDGSLN